MADTDETRVTVNAADLDYVLTFDSDTKADGNPDFDVDRYCRVWADSPLSCVTGKRNADRR